MYCTSTDTVDGRNPAQPGIFKPAVNHVIITISTGAGFLPSIESVNFDNLFHKTQPNQSCVYIRYRLSKAISQMCVCWIGQLRYLLAQSSVYPDSTQKLKTTANSQSQSIPVELPYQSSRLAHFKFQNSCFPKKKLLVGGFNPIWNILY